MSNRVESHSIYEGTLTGLTPYLKGVTVTTDPILLIRIGHHLPTRLRQCHLDSMSLSRVGNPKQIRTERAGIPSTSRTTYSTALDCGLGILHVDDIGLRERSTLSYLARATSGAAYSGPLCSQLKKELERLGHACSSESDLCPLVFLSLCKVGSLDI